jgi:5-methylcytosine-specific restriction endonuclease McrA
MQGHPALVLNADFRPVSYFPLSLLPWQDAVTAVFKEHVTVVAEYDTVIRSPSTEMRLPSVVAVRDYVKIANRVAFTRFNVFLRDRFRCQYCGESFPAQDLTFEHVIPKSKGGKTSWTNIVAACEPCNTLKDNRTDMRPIRDPSPTMRT